MTLEDKIKCQVFAWKPLIDEKGKYIPYCNKPRREGTAESHKYCEEKKCEYFIKLYIPKEDINSEKYYKKSIENSTIPSCSTSIKNIIRKKK